ncbi:PREDICTED: putative golgin subfamily A member 6-like protein 6, partial [Vollenhovia emeryi]|uniref:putative golgin subfamily A member 6-like protein 6 n=1 Tax=Vollenhovia emeryi TaxID=411798 RepID=UPI0005F5637E
NDRAGEEIDTVEEGTRTESDHVPLEVELLGPRVVETGKGKKEIVVERSDWTEEGRREYHEKCEGWKSTQTKTEDIWKEMKEKVKSAITKRKKKIIPWRLGRREWYNKEWKERKRRLRRLMREWKKGRIGKDEYVKERKEHKEWCKEQKRRHESEEVEKIRKVKNEAEAWKYINKYRKRKAEGISEEIQMEEWRNHFMEILGGTEERVMLEIEEEGEEDGEREEVAEGIEEISREEVIEVIKKLKMGKATGEDGIENEAWRFMQKEMGEEFLKLINRIWKGEGIPGDWNK